MILRSLTLRHLRHFFFSILVNRPFCGQSAKACPPRSCLVKNDIEGHRTVQPLVLGEKASVGASAVTVRGEVAPPDDQWDAEQDRAAASAGVTMFRDQNRAIPRSAGRAGSLSWPVMLLLPQRAAERRLIPAARSRQPASTLPVRRSTTRSASNWRRVCP